MPITNDEFAARTTAFTVAREFVRDVEVAHLLEPYEIKSGAAVFVTPTTSVKTPSEQVVDMSIDIANWLLKEN